MAIRVPHSRQWMKKQQQKKKQTIFTKKSKKEESTAGNKKFGSVCEIVVSCASCSLSRFLSFASPSFARGTSFSLLPSCLTENERLESYRNSPLSSWLDFVERREGSQEYLQDVFLREKFFLWEKLSCVREVKRREGRTRPEGGEHNAGSKVYCRRRSLVPEVTEHLWPWKAKWKEPGRERQAFSSLSVYFLLCVSLSLSLSLCFSFSHTFLSHLVSLLLQSVFVSTMAGKASGAATVSSVESEEQLVSLDSIFSFIWKLLNGMLYMMVSSDVQGTSCMSLHNSWDKFSLTLPRSKVTLSSLDSSLQSWSALSLVFHGCFSLSFSFLSSFLSFPFLVFGNRVRNEERIKQRVERGEGSEGFPIPSLHLSHLFLRTLILSFPWLHHILCLEMQWKVEDCLLWESNFFFSLKKWTKRRVAEQVSRQAVQVFVYEKSVCCLLWVLEVFFLPLSLPPPPSSLTTFTVIIISRKFVNRILFPWLSLNEK